MRTETVFTCTTCGKRIEYDFGIGAWLRHDHSTKPDEDFKELHHKTLDADAIKESFIRRFCNDHNGEIRWLRGVAVTEEHLLEQILDFFNNPDVRAVHGKIQREAK